MKLGISTMLAAALLAGCTAAPRDVGPGEEAARAEIAAALDDLHAAAAAADFERYFAHFAPSAVFLGTDAGERWTKPEFQDYARPYFQRGTGWAYTPVSRNITVDDRREAAWFDEVVRSAKYGDCRGTGVMRRRGGRWLVEQYNLTKPIPNELFEDVVRQIDRRPPATLAR
ncbi:MAG: nuclear transport factor 2 family protein [Phycisphaerales bacterium]|nr:nuclear transport factor 2 family protein [Phycisphaerales bacterium]